MPSDKDSFELAVALQTLVARQAVLGIAVEELLKALPADAAQRCTAAIHKSVQAFIESRPVTAIPQADEALSEELSRVLDALRR